MPNNYEFLCPACMMNDPDSGTLNTLDDIAFSMPGKDMYQIIYQAINEKAAEIASEITSKEGLFRILTVREVEEYLKAPIKNAKSWEGRLELDGQWLKDKLTRMKISADSEKLNDFSFIANFEFVFEHIEGKRIPRLVMRGRNVVSQDVRCAKCGSLLSPFNGKGEEVRILLQGNSRAGKTSGMVAIISWLIRKKWLEKKDYHRLVDEGDPDIDGASEEEKAERALIYRELPNYKSGIEVEKTPTRQKRPKVFSLPLNINGKKLVLTFVDMPGEFFDGSSDRRNGDALLQQYLPIYKNSHAVWTFIQYEVMCGEKFSDAEYARINNDTGMTKEQLETAVKMYKRRFGWLHEYITDIVEVKLPPHAVILTKSDSIAHYQEKEKLQESFIFAKDETDVFWNAPQKKSGVMDCSLNEDSFQNIAALVRSFCNDFANQDLTEYLESFSKKFCYFSMSAYGHSATPADNADHASDGSMAFSDDDPTAESESEKLPQPYHVHLPLVWSLAMLGHLKIHYQVEYWKKLDMLSQVFKLRKEECVGNGVEERFINENDKAFLKNLTGSGQYEVHRSYDWEGGN